MTHPVQILQAVAALTAADVALTAAVTDRVFTRQEIREQARIDVAAWDASYSPTLQGMRSDHPGGAARFPPRYRGVSERVAHGRHRLSAYGRQLVRELGGQGPAGS